MLTTFRAKGLVPDTHPLGAGVLGRSGTPVASWLMNESDLLVVVGASFANHTGIAPYKPIVQIDDAPPRSAASTPSTSACSATPPSPLAAAARTRSARPTAVDQRPDVAERWAIWRAEKARRAADDRGHGVVERRRLRGAVRALPRRRRRSPSTSATTPTRFGRYFESAGSAGADVRLPRLDRVRLPGGAWAPGRPTRTRPVVAVTGDGGFGQYLAELTTAVKYGIPVKHVLLDNGALGKISKEQLAGRATRSGRPRCVNPDFAEYARLCGATGIPVDHADELDDGHEGAVRRRRPGAAARPHRRRAGVTCPRGW